MSFNKSNEELIDNDPDEIDKNKSKSGKCSNSFYCWIATFFFWGSIILTIFNNTDFFPLIIFSYFIYIIIICKCSPTITFLSSKQKETVKSKLEYIFSKNVIIEFTGISYHFETQRETYLNSYGNTKTRTWEIKVETHRESELYNYKSCIDVSGLLKFELKKGENKIFVKLKLIPNIIFDNKDSENDYIQRKENFKKKAKRDTLFDFSEKKEIDCFNEYYFLQLDNKKSSCLINNCCFTIFLLLGLAQFYKWYVRSKSIYRVFTIKKLISAHRDLSSPENIMKYVNQLPKVKVVDYNDMIIESNINSLNKINK